MSGGLQIQRLSVPGDRDGHGSARAPPWPEPAALEDILGRVASRIPRRTTVRGLGSFESAGPGPVRARETPRRREPTMRTAIFGAVTMSFLLSLGVSAQHTGGAPAQPADSSQSMMQGMQERMQTMQARMQSMQERMQQMMQSHGQQGGMQMQGQEGSAQGMQAMGGQQNCIASGPQAGLSALLMGPAGTLDLTAAQRSTLETILARAQEQALAALSPEQRDQLESAPATASPVCRQGGDPSDGAASN